MRSVVLALWRRDIARKLRARDGWKLAAGAVASVVGGASLVVAFLTFAFAVQAKQLELDDEAYQRFLADLGGGSERQRIAAIARIPELMGRSGPPPNAVGPVAVLGHAFGLGLSQIHADRMRQQVQQLLTHGTADGRPLSGREAEALLLALRGIPPAIWFESAKLNAVPVGNLGYLWEAHGHVPATEVEIFTRRLLRNSVLQGVRIVGEDLRGADMRGMVCRDCAFERSDLSAADLTGATFESTSFDYVRLERAILTDSRLIDVSFYATRMRGVRIDGSALVEGCKFVQVDLGPDEPSGASADLRGARVVRSAFTDCVSGNRAWFDRTVLDETRFYLCPLDGSSFAGARGRSVEFDGSSLRAARLDFLDAPGASFTKVNLSGASMANANLRGAHFAGASGLGVSPVELRMAPIGRYTSANIASSSGLTARQRRELIRAGAVEIPCQSQWRRYKERGYPYEGWWGFLECSRGDTE